MERRCILTYFVFLLMFAIHHLQNDKYEITSAFHSRVFLFSLLNRNKVRKKYIIGYFRQYTFF